MPQKPLRASDLPAKDDVTRNLMILNSTLSIISGQRLFYCGGCQEEIIVDKKDTKPVICKKCGEEIDWIDVYTKIIKVCPECDKKFDSSDNFCPFHLPKVELVEKRIENN